MSSRGNLNIVIAVLLGVVLLMGGGLVYLSNRSQVTTTQSGDSALISQDATESAKTKPTPSAQAALVVEYTGQNALTQTDRDQITNRIVSPARDFYSDLGGDYLISKISIEATEENSYFATFIHVNKSQEGFLLPRTDDGFDWWMPPCITSCVFSKEFAEKYPLIVDPIR